MREFGSDLWVEEGACGLERNLEGDELERQVVSAVDESTLQLIDVPPHGLVRRGTPRAVGVASSAVMMHRIRSRLQTTARSRSMIAEG
jgi:hypothetical protein